ncbi:hypothetical protein MTDW_02390 [Methylophilus sp. DW102]|nr:hypothetical protein MTDW_02390 [Methylophilus sp. DW102]
MHEADFQALLDLLREVIAEVEAESLRFDQEELEAEQF